MTGNGKVSVIIPAYNAEKTLRKTVESALAQTYTNIEIIVIDDGSTDGTAESIKDYVAASRIIYIRQENMGEAGARNTGLKACTGEYVALLDSDDLWDPDKLEKQVAYLNESGDDAAFTDFRVQQEDGRVIDFPPRMRPGMEVNDNLLSETTITPSTIILKKWVVDAVGPFDAGFRYCVDWDYWLRVMQKAKIGYIPQYLVTKLDVPTSLTRAHKSKCEHYLQIYRKHVNELPYSRRNYFKKCIGRKCYYDAFKLARTGSAKDAFTVFIKAVLLNKLMIFRLHKIVKEYVMGEKAHG